LTTAERLANPTGNLDLFDDTTVEKPVLYSFVRWYPPQGTHIAASRAKTALCGVSVPKVRHMSNPCFARDVCRECMAEYLRIRQMEL
jgi:hypothetical protein